jgi:hypothetical protein
MYIYWQDLDSYTRLLSVLGLPQCGTSSSFFPLELDSLCSHDPLSPRESVILAACLYHLVSRVYLCSATYFSSRKSGHGKSTMSCVKNMVNLNSAVSQHILTHCPVGMIYLKAPGQGVLVLGSHRRVADLLDKRSANYSDRPAMPIIDMWVRLLASWSLILTCSELDYRLLGQTLAGRLVRCPMAPHGKSTVARSANISAAAVCANSTQLCTKRQKPFCVR